MPRTAHATAAVLALLAAAGLAVALGWSASRVAPGPRLVRPGGRGVPIVVPRDAIPAERTAAAELARYLGQISGSRFDVVVEGNARLGGGAIHVGPTSLALRLGLAPAELPPEAWVVRTAGSRLVLTGGRPRGALYAVYRFLEDELGVRWWTPFEETVPENRDLELQPFERSGQPVFAYRDVFGVPGPRAFCARSRLNGHAVRIPWSLGGGENYGPPKQVHTFYLYLPPEDWFEDHPEYYSEIGGVRIADGAQLCLTRPAVRRRVVERLRVHIASARAAANSRGEPPPQLFNISQNDWGRPCTCAACEAVYRREGSRSGAVVEFVNAVAEAIARQHPRVRVDTLAYGWSFAPPQHARLRDNVVLRAAVLYERDFARPLSDPAHDGLRAALAGWSKRAPHLRIWDYLVTYGDDGDLPRPSLAFLAEDLQTYRELGAEGLFLQLDPPIAGDLRDLKLWVAARLLEDPQRDAAALIAEFTDGYYGAAGVEIRGYLEALRAAAEARPAHLRFDSPAADYAWLASAFLAEAQARFDLAAAAIQGDPLLERRLRHARLSLDTATLRRWPKLPVPPPGIDPAAVLQRYRRTWTEQIGLRLPASRQAEALDELARDVEGLRTRVGEAVHNAR